MPYISEHLDAWRDKWRTALEQSGGSHQKAPVAYASLETLAPTDEGENLLSCAYAPVLKMDPNNSYPDVESLVGSGNDAPKADNLVVRESPFYDQGEFAGVTAEGRPSKIVEVMIAGAERNAPRVGFRDSGRPRPRRPHVGSQRVSERGQSTVDEQHPELPGLLDGLARPRGDSVDQQPQAECEARGRVLGQHRLFVR